MHKPWIPLARIESIVQIEPVLFILSLGIGAWVAYLVLLQKISPERHRNLRRLFANLLGHGALLVLLFAAYMGMFQIRERAWVPGILTYLGFATIVSAAVVFVKEARVLAFEYLFLANMRAGVPLLLVNLLSLLLSLIFFCWMLTSIFEVNLAPLLATSAVFSLVLGLALQDTLGNLFAGVALQFDKPYEIGDWIEVQGPLVKWVGRVHEISWRATVLISFTDEVITIPNRSMAQGEIANYSGKLRPVLRGHFFRVGFKEDLKEVERLFLQALSEIPGIRSYPEPLMLTLDTTESWVSVKLVYWIEDFGTQFVTTDKVLRSVLETLKGRVTFAGARLEVDLPARFPS
jgi:small-conductance mechanosensitive channel